MGASDSCGRQTAKAQKETQPGHTITAWVFVVVGLKSLVRSIRCEIAAISGSTSFAGSQK